MKTEINCEKRTVTVYCGEPCGDAPCDQNTVVETTPKSKITRRPVTDDLVSSWVKSWRNGHTFLSIGNTSKFSPTVVGFNIYKWLFHEQAIQIAALEEQLRVIRLDNKRLRDLLKAS